MCFSIVVAAVIVHAAAVFVVAVVPDSANDADGIAGVVAATDSAVASVIAAFFLAADTSFG